MKKVFRHIGYYNDLEDCKMLYDEKPDFIVRYMEKGLGHFYTAEGEPDTDIEDINEETDAFMFKQTTDGQYLVRYEKGDDKQLCTELRDGGWYLDIYKLTEIEVDDPEDDKVEEYCGHCDEYVYLEDELKVQVCPNCGKMIVPCSICPMLEQDNYPLMKCGSCPLAKLCEEKNGENYVGEHLTLTETAYKFNTAESNERECGFYITIPKTEAGEFDEELYLHYNKEYKRVMILDVAKQYGLAFSFNEKIDRLDLHKAITQMFGRCVEKVYVRIKD